MYEGILLLNVYVHYICMQTGWHRGLHEGSADGGKYLQRAHYIRRSHG